MIALSNKNFLKGLNALKVSIRCLGMYMSWVVEDMRRYNEFCCFCEESDRRRIKVKVTEDQYQILLLCVCLGLDRKRLIQIIHESNHLSQKGADEQT